MIYKAAINKCPTGVYSLVGHIPAYFSDLMFETEHVAQQALVEAQSALQTGHVDSDATFAHVWLTTERPFRPGTFHTRKTLVRESDLQ